MMIAKREGFVKAKTFRRLVVLTFGGYLTSSSDIHQDKAKQTAICYYNGSLLSVIHREKEQTGWIDCFLLMASRLLTRHAKLRVNCHPRYCIPGLLPMPT